MLGRGLGAHIRTPYKTYINPHYKTLTSPLPHFISFHLNCKYAP